MDLDRLIGQLFDLESKREIRYRGVLDDINEEQSTITLKDVYSYGTEGRQATEFIPPSGQKFDYIVFRGTDVKDIKIADYQKENNPPEPTVPNDPAILNASRPGQPSSQDRQFRNQPPFPPSYYSRPPHHQQPPQFQNFQNYYPQYGRGYAPPPPGPGTFSPGPPPGPPPGPGFPAMPYRLPDGFVPPVPSAPYTLRAFPPHHPPPQLPIGPPGQLLQGGSLRQPHSGPQAPKELPVNDRAKDPTIGRSVTPISTVSPPPGPTPPIETKPSVSEAPAPVPIATSPVVVAGNVVSALKAPPDTPPVSVPKDVVLPTANAPPSGPRSSRVVPALPMTVNSKSSAPIIPITTNGGSPATAPPAAPETTASALMAMEEANRQALAAVAKAMAKMNTTVQPAAAQSTPGVGEVAVDPLTKKVGDVKISDGPHGGRGGMRAQRGSYRNGSNQGRKMEIPKTDYDFELANAKFNKKGMVKEVVASGSSNGEPSEDGVDGSADAVTNGEKRMDSFPPVATEAYNKSSSFFDNISSEVKDREEMGRGRRGEERRKNLETFGQGSVDGGFRGHGRGGFRGRGRPYGAQRGYGSYGRGGEGGGRRGRGRGRERGRERGPERGRERGPERGGGGFESAPV